MRRGRGARRSFLGRRPGADNFFKSCWFPSRLLGLRFVLSEREVWLRSRLDAVRANARALRKLIENPRSPHRPLYLASWGRRSGGFRRS